MVDKVDETKDVQKSEKAATPTSEMVDSEKINEFLLKLAQATNLSENEAIDGMVRQIELLENDPNFPAIVDSLDPDQYHSQTKLLSEAGRQRLRSALEKYTEKVKADNL